MNSEELKDRVKDDLEQMLEAHGIKADISEHHVERLNACPVNAIKQNSNQVTIDERKCFGCGLCVSRCPVGALFINNEKAEVNPDNDLPTRKAQPSSAALKEQEEVIRKFLGIKHTGNMIMES